MSLEDPMMRRDASLLEISRRRLGRPQCRCHLSRHDRGHHWRIRHPDDHCDHRVQNPARSSPITVAWPSVRDDPGASSAGRDYGFSKTCHTVLELDLKLDANDALSECRRRGLVVRSERELAGRPGSRHCHLAMPGRRGTLELNDWQGRAWVKVHPRRDGGWASALAHQLAALETHYRNRRARRSLPRAVG
jgi:hypothetical protein